MHPAYLVGTVDAYTRVGLRKHANASLLRQFALPAAAGATLGGIGGAMASDEGNRLQGALIGAGLGTGGAVAGKAIGKALSKGRVAAAERELARHTPDAPYLALTKSPEEAAAAFDAAAALNKARASHASGGGELVRGTTMLGGVGGAGTGMGLAAGLDPEAPPPMPPAMNPYGY